MSEASPYWDHIYGDLEADCVKRIFNVACDFYTVVRNHPVGELFAKANKLLEVGCGTGELGRVSKVLYPNIDYLGIDISEKAISYAKGNYGLYGLRYKAKEVFSLNEEFDIAFCANVIEHFKDPYPIIDRMLTLAKHVVIVTPYNQDLVDGYDVEGGAGHVLTVTEQTYDRYNLIGSIKFFSHTWVNGADPKMFAVILKA